MNILSIEAELFAIRCGINWTTQIQDIKHIIVIMDAIPAIKWIFNSFIHLYQLHTITISNNLRNFFNKSKNNPISFWNCSSSDKWPPHLLVNKESKWHKMNPILSSRISQKFNKREECILIIKRWQMYF